MGNCSNMCADDPVPGSDLPKVEESYEYFCDTQINYAIIGVKQQVEEKYQKLAEKEGSVIFGGRLGMYRYFDMWQDIDEALKLSERLE